MSSQGLLTPLQVAVAQAFFAETQGFFLTGGAVLAGWELGHRPTDDLDLFTTSDETMARGDGALRRVAERVQGHLEVITSSPDFRRYVLTARGERLKVDLVRDRVTQLRPKVTRDGILTDSTEEIFVNKVCTLVERSEIRDLVDVLYLERKGFRVEDALPLARMKDAGVTAATLAWLLSALRVPPRVPGGLGPAEVEAYRKALETRMLAASRDTATR